MRDCDGPDQPTKGDVVRPVGISAVGVLDPAQSIIPSVGVKVGRIDVVVVVEHVGRVDNDRSPELRLDDRPVED
jgi:hypothetical protein